MVLGSALIMLFVVERVLKQEYLAAGFGKGQFPAFKGE